MIIMIVSLHPSQPERFVGFWKVVAARKCVCTDTGRTKATMYLCGRILVG